MFSKATCSWPKSELYCSSWRVVSSSFGQLLTMSRFLILQVKSRVNLVTHHDLLFSSFLVLMGGFSFYFLLGLLLKLKFALKIWQGLNSILVGHLCYFLWDLSPQKQGIAVKGSFRLKCSMDQELFRLALLWSSPGMNRLSMHAASCIPHDHSGEQSGWIKYGCGWSCQTSRYP